MYRDQPSRKFHQHAAATVWSSGQEIAGAPSVTTLTVKEQPPPPSVEVTVTTVSPIGKKDPEAWLLFISPQVPIPSALENVTLAPPPLGATTVMLLGQSKTQFAAAVPATTSKSVAALLSGV